MGGDSMKEESQLESNTSTPEIMEESPAVRRRNVVAGILLALAVLLILGFGFYLASVAIIKDGF
jgi:hypothetical protein